LQEFVGAGPLRKWGGRGLQTGSGCIQKAAGFAVDLKQALHLSLQLGVTAAGLGDVAFPLLRRQFADGVKE
jgi:hypothetical protein